MDKDLVEQDGLQSNYTLLRFYFIIKKNGRYTTNMNIGRYLCASCIYICLYVCMHGFSSRLLGHGFT